MPLFFDKNLAMATRQDAERLAMTRRLQNLMRHWSGTSMATLYVTVSKSIPEQLPVRDFTWERPGVRREKPERVRPMASHPPPAAFAVSRMPPRCPLPGRKPIKPLKVRVFGKGRPSLLQTV